MGLGQIYEGTPPISSTDSTLVEISAKMLNQRQEHRVRKNVVCVCVGRGYLHPLFVFLKKCLAIVELAPFPVTALGGGGSASL